MVRKSKAYNIHDSRTDARPYDSSVTRVTLRGVKAKVLDGSFGVRDLELQLRYYVHFRTNTLAKVMKLLMPPAMD